MRKIKGFTFIELMIVIVILTVAVLAIWRVFISSLNNIVQAKEMNIATDDLKDVLEKIKCAAFPNITTAFPDGGSVASSAVGGFLLNDETITVTYPQGTTADPLGIVVKIEWTGKDRREHKTGGDAPPVTFKTIRTGIL